jgi:hypothetical protein
MRNIDEECREEGWGRITDKALGIPPSDVESQARSVARWAFEVNSELLAALKAIAANSALNSSIGRIARAAIAKAEGDN